MSRWAIIGCGYVGEHLARALMSRGHEVWATSRTEEGAERLHDSIPGIRALSYTLGEKFPQPERFDVVVISCPPGAGAPAEERALAEALVSHQRLIYLSTTGVYADAGGDDVADDYALAPGSERSMRRLRVEEALEQAHGNFVSLRIPGIYGPNRGVHARLRNGDYRLIGAANTLVSRIYVDDLVDAIVLLGETAYLEHRAYLVGDEEPTTATEHARGVAARLGMPMPPRVNEEDVSPSVRAMLGADRRIKPARLQALGWRARHPSWREGLEAALLAEREG